MGVSAQENVATKDGGCEVTAGPASSPGCPLLLPVELLLQGIWVCPQHRHFIKSLRQLHWGRELLGGYTHTCLCGTAVATWLLHLTGGDGSSSPIHDVEADPASSRRLLRARWSWPPQKQRHLMVTNAFWYILIKQLFVFVHVLEERVIEKFQHLLTLKCYSQKKEDQFFESNFKKILFFFF